MLREELIRVRADPAASDGCERAVQALLAAVEAHPQAQQRIVDAWQHLVGPRPPTHGALLAKVALHDVAERLL